MLFIDRNGQEIITIRQLFRTKQFKCGRNSYYLFVDTKTHEEEIWTFIDNLTELIPINTSLKRAREIYEACGWCQKVSNKNVSIVLD